MVVSEQARELLISRGYDPAYGARPLKRALRELLLEPLSEKLIAGEIADGDELAVERDGERLTITRRLTPTNMA